MAFQVEFVSPEASLYSGEGTQVIARTRGGGDIAFLTGHEPFVGSLQASEVRVTELDGTVQSFAVRSGFVSVTGDSVTVLSDEATPSGQLDLEQARADLAAAEAALYSCVKPEEKQRMIDGYKEQIAKTEYPADWSASVIADYKAQMQRGLEVAELICTN